MRKALDIALKDLLIWLRDPSAMGILLGMPAILIVILGSALGGLGAGGSTRINVGVVNLDSRLFAFSRADDQAAQLEDALLDSDRITSIFRIERSRDLKTTTERVASGELAAALVIPQGFGSDLGDGRSTRLIVLIDPGSGTGGGIWESVVRAVATRYAAVSVIVRTTMQAAQESHSPLLTQAGGAGTLTGFAVGRGARDDALDGVKVEDRVASGAVKLDTLDYYSLSMTAMFLMFGAMFGAFSTIRERRERTWDRVLASPTPRASVVGGKMLGIFVLGFGQFLALYVFTRFVLHVEWGSAPAAIALVACAEIAAVTGLATLIASIAASERAVGGIGPLVIQIQALIGGAFFPVAILPSWLQWVRYLSVVGWTMEGWRRVQVLGAGVPGVLGPTAALLGFAVAFFAFGVWRTEHQR